MGRIVGWGLGASTALVVIALGIVALVVALDANQEEQPTLADLVADVQASVVTVVVRTDDPGGGQGVGSGFVVDADGHVITNFHVVQDAEEVLVQFGGGEPIPGALTDPINATIHLVLRDHGPALEGDALTVQLTEFEPTAADAASVGNGLAFDVQAAVSDGPE